MASQLLSVEVDKKTLAEVEYMLSTVKFGVNDALRIAANKTGETARSRVVKKIAETLTLTQKRIKQDTKLYRANFGNLTSKVAVKSKPIPIIDFKHGVQTKTGINVTVRKGNRVKYRHQFIAKMSNGHVGIFERKLLAGGRAVARLPIEEQYGPSIALVFHSNGEDEVFKEMAELYPRKLLEQAVFLLNKAT